MKKNFGLVLAVVALAALAAWAGSVQAYEVRGDVNSGWGAAGGSLWYDVLKETASSTAGGYDDAATPPVYGVMKRPPSTTDLPNPLNPTNHNWTEVNYLLVTGKYGHKVLYSTGEVDPRFGNKEVTITCSSGSKKGKSCEKKAGCELAGSGRSVKDVSTIDVTHAFTNIKGVANDARPYGPWIVVSGAGITPKTYDLAALQAMTQVTFDASTSTSNTKGIWTGPRLVDVLKASGVDTRDMNSYIIIQGADGYATLYSMYEATHELGLADLTTCPSCLPGYAMLGISGWTYNKTTGQFDKQSLNNGSCTDAESAGTTCSDGGIVRTVLPGDWQAGRWISNAAQIIVYKLNGFWW